MPWKFIVFVVICVLFSIFAALNFEPTAKIDFVFAKVEGAPIFLVVLFSFLTGTCVGLLASMFKRSKKLKKEKLERKVKKEVAKTVREEDGAPDEAMEKSPAERRRGRKRK